MCAGIGPRCDLRVASRFALSSAFFARAWRGVPLGALWKPARILPISAGLARRISASSALLSAPPKPAMLARPPRLPPPKPPRWPPPRAWNAPVRANEPNPPLAPFAGPSFDSADFCSFASSAASCDCEAFLSSLSRPGFCRRSWAICAVTLVSPLPNVAAAWTALCSTFRVWPTMLFSWPLRSSISFLNSAMFAAPPLPEAIEFIRARMSPISCAPSARPSRLPLSRERTASIRARWLRSSPLTASVRVRCVAVARCESVFSSRPATESRCWWSRSRCLSSLCLWSCPPAARASTRIEPSAWLKRAT